ncbi:MAG TPA: hypothetical protein DEA50_03145, partial [Parvularcula sp.]|nr:hypothetical protein [Parvularcula sp.]
DERRRGAFEKENEARQKNLAVRRPSGQGRAVLGRPPGMRQFGRHGFCTLPPARRGVDQRRARLVLNPRPVVAESGRNEG